MNPNSHDPLNSLIYLSFPPSFFEDEVREGFFVSGLMKRFWAGQLAVLSEVAKVCRRHDIPWFLDSGTLLGAVRHRGYIPWDDDLDIVMLRHDLNRFLSVAEQELPPDFHVARIETLPSFDNMHLRVTNDAKINWDMENLTRFFDCPFHVGIDLFALDGLYADETKEKERKERRFKVHNLCHYMIRNGKDSAPEELLREIEEENRITLPRDEGLYLALRLLQKRIYSECPSEDAERLELFFNIDSHYEAEKAWFDDVTYLPFEHLTLPVPAGFHNYLCAIYGEYRIPLRDGGAAHNYPAYRDQETLLAKQTGANVFRYTLAKENLPAIRDGQASAHNASERTAVFLVFRARHWHLCAGLYDQVQQEGYSALVILVPWHEKLRDGSRGITYDEQDLFPPDIVLTTPGEFDPAMVRPCVIYTLFPYDGTNRDIDIDDRFYSEALREQTDHLVYLPCFDTDPPDVSDERLRIMLSTLAEQPAVVFADEVMLPSEAMRALYIDTLTERCGDGSREYWTKKIRVQPVPPKSTLDCLYFPPAFFEDEVREGFFVSGMMKRYWAAELRVLSEIDRVCRAHGIPWYIEGGTLLGAVRHKGFIPWDDDIDILMYRHDLDRFVEIARQELPEEYHVADLQTDPTYTNTTVRVLNSTSLNTYPERMKVFFGCPYTVGVDIFSLDGLYEDAERETQRRARLNDLYIAAGYVNGKAEHTTECKELLMKIERDHSIRFDDSIPLFQQLLRLQIKLFREVPAKDAPLLGEFFGMTDLFFYLPEWFGSGIPLPFETTMLPAPAAPGKVLETLYQDYMTVVKGGSAHEYPSFERQERLLRTEIGRNPYRYTLSKEDIFRPRETTAEGKISQMTALLQQAQEKIEEFLSHGDVASAGTLAESCKKLASHLEALLAGRREVVFLIPRAAWWPAMAGLYEWYSAREDLTVRVIPIPLFEKRLDGSRGTRHDDRHLLPQGLPLTMSEHYDLSVYMPSVIVTCFPYDSTNRDLDIDPSYYSFRLRECTDRLIYCPCHQPNPPVDNDTAAKKALRVLIEQPAAVFADTVVVENTELRDYYVETLTELSGEETRSRWEEKVLTSLC
ncbi:MAG: LicD family protein [Lachnospiraceae bacterium]|nr:LicD family protein [Lachnospiraceae bacterium]